MSKWKKIEGYPQYKVSYDGRVRSFNPYLKSGFGKELKPQKLPNGYLIVQLSKPGQVKKTKLISRLVAEAFIPNPLGLPEVNHKDHDKENNFYLNLEWCTSSYNKLWAHYCGRFPKREGEKSGLALKTPDEVIEIRLMKENNPNMTYKEIAKKFNTSASSIGKIIRWEQWRNI